MAIKLFLITLATGFLMLNCKNKPKASDLDYIYASENVISECKLTPNIQLLNEAVLSFENDLINFYDPENKSPNRAYTKFLSAIRNRSIDYSSIVSPHSKTIFEILKQDDKLWNLKNKANTLNYQNPIIACIIENIKPSEFTITLKALAHTNSLSFRMYDEELRRNTILASQDKYLGLFIALDLYYGKLFDIYLSPVKH